MCVFFSILLVQSKLTGEIQMSWLKSTSIGEALKGHQWNISHTQTGDVKISVKHTITIKLLHLTLLKCFNFPVTHVSLMSSIVRHTFFLSLFALLLLVTED